MMEPMTMTMPTKPQKVGISLKSKMPKTMAAVGSAPEARMDTTPDSRYLKEILKNKFGSSDPMRELSTMSAAPFKGSAET